MTNCVLFAQMVQNINNNYKIKVNKNKSLDCKLSTGVTFCDFKFAVHMSSTETRTVDLKSSVNSGSYALNK